MTLVETRVKFVLHAIRRCNNILMEHASIFDVETRKVLSTVTIEALYDAERAVRAWDIRRKQEESDHDGCGDPDCC